jgi:hypothetical protein
MLLISTGVSERDCPAFGLPDEDALSLDRPDVAGRAQVGDCLAHHRAADAEAASSCGSVGSWSPSLSCRLDLLFQLVDQLLRQPLPYASHFVPPSSVTMYFGSGTPSTLAKLSDLI